MPRVSNNPTADGRRSVADDPVKIVVVGDATVGKTSLIMSFAKNEFPDEYAPTIFDNFAVTMKVRGFVVKCTVWDTAGQHEFKPLRTISYQNADIFIFLFDVTNPTSYENVKNFWIQELQSQLNNTDCEYWVCGTKIDLRNDEDTLNDLTAAGERMATAEDGQALARDIGALGYMETSAYRRIGLQELFDTVLAHRLNLNAPTLEESKGGCVIS